VQLSTTSATQLEADEKIFKKTFSAGRRELEHEFGKTMALQIIRIFPRRQRQCGAGPENHLAHEPVERVRHLASRP